ncbi:MAG: D-alanine--D-alanine ligase [Gammaproteobacteria bacterium]|nr:MAG: D-alanine--D-alanine ligase [Gammaproteobacteria bacterium]
MTTAINRYGHVAVLAGGKSNEREISLQGGEAVCTALDERGIQATLMDISESLPKRESIDRAFIMVHGQGGEDGKIQGYLETVGLPYTGSGVQASSICMNKYLTKLIWKDLGLCTPEHILASDCHSIDPDSITYPVIVKPTGEGSSIGMSRVECGKTLEPSINQALQYSSTALIERWVDGDELTVSILGDQSLPVICVKTPRQFYDFDAKYRSNKTEYIFPDYDDCDLAYIQSMALKAFQATGATGWGRVDLIRDHDGTLWLLEINTVPGMTRHSLVPKAAEKAGINFAALCEKILETSL